MADSGVQYANSGGVDIAWTVAGDGPLDIVYVPGFISHLDLAREIPAFDAIQSRLERLGRVLRFDKRGTGLSGRDLGFGSLAERADDIRAVMDAAGWEQAHLLGVSEGGPLSVVFAASNPKRVLSLTLYGSFACLLPDDDPLAARFDSARFIAGMEKRWGTGVGLRPFINAPDEPEVTEMLARYERACASPRVAASVMRANFQIDARSVLPTVSARTLVVHQTGDPVVPVSRGRALAAGIPGAQLVELDGDMHCCWTVRQWTPALDAVEEEFLTGMTPGLQSADRVLATVLFTDIVESTRAAAETGDALWRTVLDRHDQETGRFVARFDGRVIKQTGDGALATFDSPAVYCARALRDAVRVESIPIRAGVHTGEVERRGDDIGGIGVHIGARIAALAGPGDVLVSRTVHDLVVGSDLRFEDAGVHTLKGVPNEWQVFRSV